MGKSSSRKLRRVIDYTLYRMDPQKNALKNMFFTKLSTIQNYKKRKKEQHKINKKKHMFAIVICFTTRLPFGNTKPRKVATQTNLYKTYREILFQKVASGYLLHFVQDGSSKSVLEN